jgi:glycosyltransferase involved in cell wall biosynthesis
MALQSVINQTYRPIEILVLDHDSTADIQAIAAAFDEPVRYYRHTGTYLDTHNVWRDMVAGEYVTVLDDDDFIAPRCIEKEAYILNTREDIHIVFPRYQFFFVKDGQYELEMLTPRLDNRTIHKKLLVKCVLHWNAVLFRKECIRNIPDLDGRVIGAFDWYIWIQMALAGYRFYQVNDFLGYVQRSQDSIQAAGDRIVIGRSQCIKYHGDRLPFFTKLFRGYYSGYGYHLICLGISCLENGNSRRGRMVLIKGILMYSFGLKNRLKLIPALFILFASVVSVPAKARGRIEKLLRNYLFRIRTQREGAGYAKAGKLTFWRQL